MVKENPSLLELDVITATDDEGNGYNWISYTPSFGTFNEDNELEDTKAQEATVFCVN